MRLWRLLRSVPHVQDDNFFGRFVYRVKDQEWISNDGQNADIGFVCYFNQDNSSSADLPAHLIKTWPGIDDPSVNCVRFPVGDDNRCGARAFKQWMAAN